MIPLLGLPIKTSGFSKMEHYLHYHRDVCRDLNQVKNDSFLQELCNATPLKLHEHVRMYKSNWFQIWTKHSLALLKNTKLAAIATKYLRPKIFIRLPKCAKRSSKTFVYLHFVYTVFKKRYYHYFILYMGQCVYS